MWVCVWKRRENTQGWSQLYIEERVHLTMQIAADVVDEIAQAIRKLALGGMAVLIAEQNATMALGIADRAYVLEGGRILLSGAAAALKERPEVQRIYLGA